MTKKLAMFLFAVAIAGCGSGVTTDPEIGTPPPGDDTTPLETLTAPAHLLSNVLATAALTADPQNDAIYFAVVAQPDGQTAKLVRHDIRATGFTDVDSMPIGKGAAQIVTNNADGIVWGFIGDGLAAGSFRFIATNGVASAISFATHAPTFFLLEERTFDTHDAVVIYHSASECALEQIGFNGGDFLTKAAMSCFATIESAVPEGSFLWLRTDDAPGKTVWQLDMGPSSGLQPVVSGLTSVVGPIANAAGHAAVWITPGQGGAHVFSTADNSFPAGPQDILTIPGNVDAATYVNGVLWGVTLGNTTTLFQVTPSGLIRYPVDYKPESLFGLHDRLVVLTSNGELIEQLLTPAQ